MLNLHKINLFSKIHVIYTAIKLKRLKRLNGSGKSAHCVLSIFWNVDTLTL